MYTTLEFQKQYTTLGLFFAIICIYLSFLFVWNHRQKYSLQLEQHIELLVIQ